MAFRIAGTTALVTGANRGIGRALVEALIARGATKVYATARRPEALADIVGASGGRVVPLKLDVTSPEDVRAAAAAAADVQLLFNNAGVAAKFDGALTDPGWLAAARGEFEVYAVHGRNAGARAAIGARNPHGKRARRGGKRFPQIARFQ